MGVCLYFISFSHEMYDDWHECCQIDGFEGKDLPPLSVLLTEEEMSLTPGLKGAKSTPIMIRDQRTTIEFSSLTKSCFMPPRNCKNIAATGCCACYPM
ncbi:hypothetical protein Naga_100249g6 [Nannochloropsis gaditana]|uniref:Uncharacterized protein n=1 Tax=Nannochloropsis gaditana TaxID=72520 RepID=W7TB44_9STRA|nr:hypothetical protein Naga_100249g6 [Nannochloropsis gaditana]